MYARLPLMVSSAVAKVYRTQTDYYLCRTGGSDTVSVPSRASTIGSQYVKKDGTDQHRLGLIEQGVLQVIVRRLALGENLLKSRSREPLGHVAQKWEGFHQETAGGSPPYGVQGVVRHNDTRVILVYDIDAVDDLDDGSCEQAEIARQMEPEPPAWISYWCMWSFNRSGDFRTLPRNLCPSVSCIGWYLEITPGLKNCQNSRRCCLQSGLYGKRPKFKS